MPRITRLRRRRTECLTHGKKCAWQEPTRWCRAEGDDAEIEEQLRPLMDAMETSAEGQGRVRPPAPVWKPRGSVAQIDALLDAEMAAVLERIEAMNEETAAGVKAQVAERKTANPFATMNGAKA